MPLTFSFFFSENFEIEKGVLRPKDALFSLFMKLLR